MKMSLHAAMVHRMDIEIGRVLGQLAVMGALENTVIFFLSDNGATAEMIVRGDGHDRNALPGSERAALLHGARLVHSRQHAVPAAQGLGA